jgi:DNA phosphorothioation-associated putative methyltransferase
MAFSRTEAHFKNTIDKKSSKSFWTERFTLKRSLSPPEYSLFLRISFSSRDFCLTVNGAFKLLLLDRATLAERRLAALRPVLERLWRQMLSAGRPLVDEEVPADLLSDIEQQIGSLRRAERLCGTQFDVNELATAGNARKGDLLVYFGLNLFNGRTRYSSLVPELQRDIKVLFGNATSAFEAARAVLFSVGKTEVIEQACRRAAAAGCGHLFADHSLQTHSSLINRLPAALRCYVGCAAKLYGDVDAADLVKIHIRSGKLTLLFYNNFDSSPLPKLRERIKINMRSQKINFFDYSRGDEQQLLFMKSKYMAPDQEGYERQKAFDDALEKLCLFDFDLSQFGPPTSVFTAALASAGYSIDGFTIAARSQ